METDMVWEQHLPSSVSVTWAASRALGGLRHRWGQTGPVYWLLDLGPVSRGLWMAPPADWNSPCGGLWGLTQDGL